MRIQGGMGRGQEAVDRSNQAIASGHRVLAVVAGGDRRWIGGVRLIDGVLEGLVLGEWQPVTHLEIWKP